MGGPARRDVREFLDTPGQDPRELRLLLGDIRRVNRRYGGSRLVLRHLTAITAAIPRRPLTLLDVASGGADVPLRIVEWAAARRIQLRIVAVDVNPDVLEAAGEKTKARDEVRLVRADALALPFPDGTFDIVTCGLTLHHFSLEGGALALREIDRVAREAFVVNDIVRSWAGYAGAWLDTRLFARSRLARHDGPVSVLRAFTVPELRRMIALAGLDGVEIVPHPLFRVALVRRPRGIPS